MRTRTYTAVATVESIEIYGEGFKNEVGVLILFPDAAWIEPYFVYTYDNYTVISQHKTKDEAAEILKHWRASCLKITRTG